MEQTKLFTSEEQSGSGQTNLFHKVDESKARISHLRRTPHKFWHDPGHGWLQVDNADLDILKIRDKISAYSYRKGDKAYLEEDMDAFTYVKALWGQLLNSAEYELWKNMMVSDYQEHIFIRSCVHFK